MFDTFTPVRGSLLKQRINTVLGTLFLSTFALWSALIMIQTKWGVNPIAQAFAAAIERETTLP